MLSPRKTPFGLNLNLHSGTVSRALEALSTLASFSQRAAGNEKLLQHTKWMKSLALGASSSALGRYKFSHCLSVPLLINEPAYLGAGSRGCRSILHDRYQHTCTASCGPNHAAYPTDPQCGTWPLRWLYRSPHGLFGNGSRNAWSMITRYK